MSPSAVLVLPLMLAGAAITPPLARVPFQVAAATLPNGLRVLVAHDRACPTAAVHVVYRAGSRDERPGATGLAHLFEHMMFNGSARFAPGRLDRIVEAGGGSSNAHTTADSTHYYEETSVAALDAVLRLEADRMRRLRIDRPNLEQERGIVMEERRISTDDDPRGAMHELLWNTAYVAHPYRSDVIGSMPDLRRISLDEARAFYDRLYRPDNAVLAIVGGMPPRMAIARARRHFGGLRAPRPTRLPDVTEPAQRGRRRSELSRPAALAGVLVGYKACPDGAADSAAIELVALALGSGESSRLHTALVRDQQIAASASAYADLRRDSGLLVVYAQAQSGRTGADLESAVDDVVARVRQNGLTEREIRKAKNQWQLGFATALKTNAGLAEAIGSFEALRGGWRALNAEARRFERVTAADVKRIASRYLRREGQTSVILVPSAPGEESR